MKLIEIFDVPLTQKDFSADNGTELGNGGFADVHASKSDPHAVNRIRSDRRPFKEDAYPYYINKVTQSGIWKENPTFPRVYERGQNDKHIQLERLYTGATIEVKTLLAYYKNNFILEDEESEVDKMTSDDLSIQMAMAIHLALADEDFSLIKNKQIINAIKWIDKCRLQLAREGHEFNVDIHSENIMFRRIPNGIQLVISDPLY